MKLTDLSCVALSSYDFVFGPYEPVSSLTSTSTGLVAKYGTGEQLQGTDAQLCPEGSILIVTVVCSCCSCSDGEELKEHVHD